MCSLAARRRISLVFGSLKAASPLPDSANPNQPPHQRTWSSRPKWRDQLGLPWARVEDGESGTPSGVHRTGRLTGGVATLYPRLPNFQPSGLRNREGNRGNASARSATTSYRMRPLRLIWRLPFPEGRAGPPDIPGPSSNRRAVGVKNGTTVAAGAREPSSATPSKTIALRPS